ncbi:carboxymuconolactone decarboxylase family protein [Methyloversatilis thermotolerans]|uniref:carboxymuconolactone decarboxylase family protein n=1 Tax=Methyloversatilis thermotolerans TaxID=1346290 RepID=UPI00036C9B72|nr:carboxymuconolactone decarboxylase family protein [Methyloversatilis thermotolerans]
MHSLRLPYFRLAADAFKTLYSLSDLLAHGKLDRKLVELVYLRVSQMNGCAYCLDMHATELRRLGEDSQRLDTVAGWRECGFFSDAERAALDWAESLTRIADSAPDDAQFAALQAHFDDAQIAELTFVVATINAWNRIAISMRQPVERRSA